jgi:hypothetical protein
MISGISKIDFSTDRIVPGSNKINFDPLLLKSVQFQ